ncbi:MAG TPA: hypothetical protein VNX68_07095 [Nitrosopumilaceae archaeon]|jgi:hypothetical protein|nr:hypothetical protein [Nitrosopumilaceae archaeon]
MKPYGRDGNIKGSGKWKTDYHIIINNKKIQNWWEVIKDFCKKGARRKAKQQIKKDINDNE